MRVLTDSGAARSEHQRLRRRLALIARQIFHALCLRWDGPEPAQPAATLVIASDQPCR